MVIDRKPESQAGLPPVPPPPPVAGCVHEETSRTLTAAKPNKVNLRCFIATPEWLHSRRHRQATLPIDELPDKLGDGGPHQEVGSELVGDADRRESDSDPPRGIGEPHGGLIPEMTERPR